MKELLKIFENKKPEIVFHWNDPETEAEGWVVINSLRGGAAGGGTRMRVGLDKREVESLAKTMEVKFTVSGPSIGGAKSGIDFDPSDPRKRGVLERWYNAVAPLLRAYYGTGGDLNVDEVHEVIPITEDCGVWHPQEGVFTGHFKPNSAQKIRRIGALRVGVKKVVENPHFSPNVDRKYVVADLITGYGVAESVRHFYSIYGGSLVDKKVIIQGWGNVGSAAAYYLAQEGASIVGIIDRAGGIIRPDGLSLEEVKTLFLRKDGNKLNSPDIISFEEVNEKIWDMDAEVFLPCAASRLVSEDQVDRLISKSLEVISCGANVPFADPEIFYGSIAEKVDNSVSLIPDFISNCGMARVFAYLMGGDAEIEDEEIFNDASHTIRQALVECHNANSNRIHLTHTAFEIALKKLI
ncbi:MAG: Glu/Leu/Phe/Val dehydrogenase [Flavobacteriales bacterium]|nr:Glu/Leu/Phe/Val dehydrogenase [Flavobacteriales bacterium]